MVCFPAPLGCFRVPMGDASSVDATSAAEEYADEFVLSDSAVATILRAQASPDCFLCVEDAGGDEDE